MFAVTYLQFVIFVTEVFKRGYQHFGLLITAGYIVVRNYDKHGRIIVGSTHIIKGRRLVHDYAAAVKPPLPKYVKMHGWLSGVENVSGNIVRFHILLF